MKTATTTAAQLEEAGRRLDASYHASDGIRAHQFIRQWAGQTTRRQAIAKETTKERVSTYSKRRLDTLAEVCVPEGVFIPARFKRIYVDDPAHGAPYLTGGSIMQADPLAGAKLLSYRYTTNIDELALHERMILITCSGTIGNCVYVNANFKGAVGSPDLIRIIANPKEILPGYLYAWLRSPLARALIEQKTYGAVIPHIEAHHVVDLPVPRLDAAIEQRIHELVEQAARQRASALTMRRQAVDRTSTTLKVDLNRWRKSHYCVSSASRLASRLESSYHVARKAAEAAFAASVFPVAVIGTLLTDMFYLGKLHRVFVADATSGVPLLSISDIQKAKLSSGKFISRTRSRNIEQAILQTGWVLVSRSGTPGLVIYTREEMHGLAGSDDLIRLVPDQSKITSGYLYAVLSSVLGQGLLQSALHGSVQSHLPPEYISQLEIPVPPVKLQASIHTLMDGFAQALTMGSMLEDQSQALLTEALGLKGAL